ncbi:MAG: dUTP diphosphatase, partial [Chloroflexi bacterium]|nr:dUTP diphosphatase [Chloroflexota bacterium]
VGTIDSDYRGELFVTMYTVGSRGPHIVHNGDRIAQLVLSLMAPVSLTTVAELPATSRGERGHGSTGA